MKYTTILRLAFLCAFGWTLIGSANAQNLLLGPSTSEYDAVSLFANPALTAFQDSKIGIGARSYHMGLGEVSGLSDIRQGYVVASKKNLFRHVIGTGVGIQYFDSPIFKRMRTSLLVAARFLRFASVGADVGVVRVSYNENEFDLVDANDPVFADGTSLMVPTASVGLFLRPVYGISLSAGVRDLISPQTSLVGADVPDSANPYGGLSVAYRAVRLTGEVVSTINGVQPTLSVEFGSSDGSYLRLASAPSASFGSAEVQYRFGPRVLLNYQFHMPWSALSSVSTGTHQVGLTFEFGPPEPPEYVPPLVEYFVVQPDTLIPVLEPKTHLAAETDIFTIYEKVLERRVAPDVPESALRSLSRADLGTLDSTFFYAEKELRSKMPVAVDSDQQNITSPISDEYNQAIAALARNLIVEPEKNLDIIVSLPALGKGTTVRNMIADEPGVDRGRIEMFQAVGADSLEDGLTRNDIRRPDFAKEEFSFHEPEQTVFDVMPIFYDSDTVVRWQFEITDMNGDTISELPGTGAIPLNFTWNWTDSNGQLIDAGIYFYRLLWTGPDGVEHESRMRKIIVVKNVRRIVFDVSTKPPGPEDGVKRRELIIRNN